MTEANFDKLKTLWTDANISDGTWGVSQDQGNVYIDNMITTPLTPPLGTVVVADKTDPVRGHAPFTRFTCTAVDAIGAGK